MASKQRFRTLGRDENRLGRLSVEFFYKKSASRLTVFVGKARNLSLPLETGQLTGIAQGTFLQARIQILPSKNTPQVVASLFSMTPPKQNEFRMLTRMHCETLHPEFDEVRELACSVFGHSV
jgi:hypothetical protein